MKWDQTAIEYVKKMKKLCEDQGAALVMVKIPTMYMPQEWYGSWSYDKYIMVKKLCDEMGIPFLDMVYDKGYPAEIDWQQDTLDHGMHLNIRGAEKVTKRFGKYMEDMGLEKKICEFYWNCFRDYEYMSQICALQSECNLNEYLSGALEGGNYTIVISAQNDFQTALSEENVQILSKTGFRSNFTEGIRDSFIGIIRQGEVKYEALSNRKIEYEDFLPGGGKMEIISSGYNTGAYSSIMIEGQEYSMNRSGLNIVVFDNDTQLVVDSVNFNTQYPAASGYRDPGMTRSCLTQYKVNIIGNDQ